MTEEQYWDGDTSLVRAYRKADEMRRKRRNEELWLQGAYIYEALCDVSPVLRPFAKAGTKPVPYPEEPYPITVEDMREREEREKREKMEVMKRRMLAFTEAVNKKLKEGEIDA